HDGLGVADTAKPAARRRDAAGAVVLGPRDLAPRGGAHLPPLLALRGASGAARRARLVLHLSSRNDSDRRRARTRRRAAGSRQRLPSSRPRGRKRMWAPRDAPMPLSRL